LVHVHQVRDCYYHGSTKLIGDTPSCGFTFMRMKVNPHEGVSTMSLLLMAVTLRSS